MHVWMSVSVLPFLYFAYLSNFDWWQQMAEITCDYESVWQADGECEQLIELHTTQECHLLMIIIIIINYFFKKMQGLRMLSYWGQQLICNLCLNLLNLYCCCYCQRDLILAWHIRLNRSRCSVCLLHWKR